MTEVLDEALKQFSAEELLHLEHQFSQMLQLIKNRKIQKLMEEQNLILQRELAYIQGLNQSPLSETIKEMFNIQDSATTLPPDPIPISDDTTAEVNSRDSQTKVGHDLTMAKDNSDTQDPTSDGSSESKSSSRYSHT